MNYLAHAYLSFKEPQVLVGNMISDFVKGKKHYDYPPLVLVGIKLHRAIDAYADLDPFCKKIASYFSESYRLYGAAFADVVCDYFLANDEHEFASADSLDVFCQNSYKRLEAHKEFFDPVFSLMFPFMKEQNWLYNYRGTEGIRKSFRGLQKRSKYIKETDTAFATFLEHKEEMRIHYDSFFPNVKKFAEKSLQELLKTP